jgi:hypothetical protein
LRKLPNDRYVAKHFDKLLRVLTIPTPEGKREIALTDSRQATLAAEYSNAVQLYLQTGNVSALPQFRKKSIRDATGAQVVLLTDLKELDRLGSEGALSFESLYTRSE